MTNASRILLILALAAAPGAAWAQGTAPQGRPPQGGPSAAARAQGAAPQAAGQIRGVVRDGATGQPLASASVGIRSAADSSLVTGALTRPDGSFRIEGLQPGRYLARVSFLGYAPQTTQVISLTPQALSVDLGVIGLATSAVQLEGITATAERSQAVLAPDRNSYTVRDMPATAGGNTVDVLRNVPSIEVDGENRVSLRGNENVVVQINGRPAPMRGDQLGNFLAQLPANVVERVEVIPNPSARYDPEGMAGIINVVLKQNTDLGLSGGLTLGGGSTGQLNGSGNLGYQAGPLTLFGSYGFMRDEREISGFNNTRYLVNPSFSEQDISGTMQPQSHNLTMSGDLKLSSQGTLSANLIVNRRAAEMTNLNILRQRDAGQNLTGTVNNLTDSENDALTLDYVLGYRHAFQPRTNELSAEVRFNREAEDRLSRFTREPLSAQGQAVSQPLLETNATDELRNNWTLQADWMRMLGERTKLEMGYKGVLRQMDNDLALSRFSYDQNAYLPDLARSNSFVYDENIQAVYGVLSRNLGRFDVQAGLRAERAATQFDLTTTQERFDNDYSSLFPSALIAFNADEKRQIKASYSKRIQRPDTRMLNPFGFTPDPLNIFRGNPYLQPEYTHAFELGYQQSFDQGSLQLTPFYRHTVDAVRRLRTMDDEGVSTMSFANVATSDSYGADLNGSLRLGRLTGFGGFSAFQQVTDATNLSTDLSNTAIGWSARANATLRISPTLDAQGFLMYRAPMNAEQGRISAMTMTNIALRQKLMGDRASVSLRVMDPFNTMGFGSEINDPRFFQETQRKFGARGVFLSFSYNFGQQPRVRQQRPQEQNGGGQQESPIP
ncbi:TonB-dependent receptor [soil metagenome]